MCYVIRVGMGMGYSRGIRLGNVHDGRLCIAGIIVALSVGSFVDDIPSQQHAMPSSLSSPSAIRLAMIASSLEGRTISASVTMAVSIGSQGWNLKVNRNLK